MARPEVEYQVAAAPIARRHRSLALVPVVAGLAVVAVGLLGTRLGPDPRTALASSDRHSSASAPSSVAPSTTDEAARTPATFGPPPWILVGPNLSRVTTCGAMPLYDCRRAVFAAASILAPGRPAIREAAADPSLICGTDLDCPPDLLEGGRRVGSVAFTFVDDTRLWVNVVEPAPDGVREGSPRSFVSVVVRSFD
jgi:hypothetical protein